MSEQPTSNDESVTRRLKRCCDLPLTNEHTRESATMPWLRHLRDQGLKITDVKRAR